ncbi:molybdopterin-dependent oxidoreductase [Pseudonocardia adelaidensis]|uniref:DMSO/TMAO reductase YedYZ molybdopterin-dependent catalytic subunit n=1 Tax=Pseudonocardia adelaidensis TaxID=648754 RepID=A0ABP9NRT5_9PSEU
MPQHYPPLVIITHLLNILFMVLLGRSGLEVLAAHPKLYWSDHCPPGRQWLRLSRKEFGSDSRRPWTSQDEEESWNPVLALPGRKNLGLGRHWHFLTLQFWIATGVVYIAFAVASGYWRYLVPTSWSVFPQAVRDVGTYLTFRFPAQLPGEPFNAAQKLAYFAVVFLLAPLQIATGAAMSPAVIGRFPWYAKLFGGKQGARSLHFLGLVAFAAFTVLHTAMVILHGLPEGLAKILLGSAEADHALAVGIGLLALALIIIVQVLATVASLRSPRTAERLTGAIAGPMQRGLSRLLPSCQRYRRSDISPYHRVNGYPPTGEEYERAARRGSAGYRLVVGGLVEQPAAFSLDELRALGTQHQIVNHNCIQGWNAIAAWAGVPVARLLDVVRPLPQARYAVFYAMDDKGLTDGREGRYGYYYEAVALHLLRHDQSLLAMDMNGGPLPVEHGAPLRLRVENQLGFKMVKWVRGIELVERVDHIGRGRGGFREDQQYYANPVGI